MAVELVVDEIVVETIVTSDGHGAELPTHPYVHLTELVVVGPNGPIILPIVCRDTTLVLVKPDQLVSKLGRALHAHSRVAVIHSA